MASKRKRDNRPASELTPMELLDRMDREARRTWRECDQCIIDGEYWMRINEGKGWTVDLEWFKVMKAKCASLLDQVAEHKRRLRESKGE